MTIKFFNLGCKKVNDAALNALANFCPEIEVLNLHSCDVSWRIDIEFLWGMWGRDEYDGHTNF